MSVCVCVLTPAADGVLPTGHHILALLVLPGDHLKLDAGVPHPVVSMATGRRFNQCTNKKNETLLLYQPPGRNFFTSNLNTS